MKPGRGLKMVLQSRMEGDNKENSPFQESRFSTRTVKRNKPTSENIQKSHLREENIFQYPVSYRQFAGVQNTVNEYSNSQEYIQTQNLDDLRSKLFPKNDDSITQTTHPVNKASLNTDKKKNEEPNLPSFIVKRTIQETEISMNEFHDHFQVLDMIESSKNVTSGTIPSEAKRTLTLSDENHNAKNINSNQENGKIPSEFDLSNDDINCETLSHRSPSTPTNPSQSLLEDSDDSVKDKDYVPLNESSTSVTDSEPELEAKNNNKTLRKNKPNAGDSRATSDHTSCAAASDHTCEETVEEAAPSTSQNIIEGSVSIASVSILNQEENLPSTSRWPLNEDIQSAEAEIPIPDDTNEEEENIAYTKRGTIRKRKQSDISVQEKKRLRTERSKSKHSIVNAGQHSCRLNCNEKITDTRREEINSKYWLLSWREQKLFVSERITVTEPYSRKKPASDSRRQKSIKYTLKDEADIVHPVCKEFFLNTLGYQVGNSSAIEQAMKLANNSDLSDKRGTNKKKTVDRSKIVNHIESFNPAISHYRREHAPNTRYLPPELTVSKMYKYFCEDFGEICSYDAYRETVKSMNISFAKLGHEECEKCEAFKLHNPDDSLRHYRCETCKTYEQHIQRAKGAREHYQLKPDIETVIYSADLQKVIMLPRIESLKAVLFCPRLIAFNESFVPVGKGNGEPIAVLWHEATSGRKKEDIASTFEVFFTEVRDAKHIILWLDNCAAQNKNWALFSYIVYVVNSKKIDAMTITLNYFEPGHTFMSADSFHHQVELSMKRKGKIFDFNDFKEAVSEANSGKVKVKEMTVQHFFKYEDCMAPQKVNNRKPRPYLNEMVQVKFTRGKFTITYKKSFDDEHGVELDFMKQKCLKNGLPQPTYNETARGITSKRKEDILQRLSSVMPSNRIEFWRSLRVNDDLIDLRTNDED